MEICHLCKRALKNTGKCQAPVAACGQKLVRKKICIPLLRKTKFVSAENEKGTEATEHHID